MILRNNTDMQSHEIRRRFLEFFRKRGHAIVPSAPLVPENDPSVLFTTAGMQPLVPYLLGAPHPSGTRIANAQKCVRTQDIEEIGDNTHDTFFEMLGNWSLGDYFKEDAIKWSYEFLTSQEEGLGLDPNRLYVTVFGGNDDAPRDDESFAIWKRLGIPERRIYFMTAGASGKEPNWWSPGDNGPSGPDTEMFYDVTKKGLGDLTKEEYMVADDRQEIVEIWNDVFMEYEKKDGRVIGKLAKKNVDTGAGLERLAMVMQKTDNVFATDLFSPLLSCIAEHSSSRDTKAERIVADHIRTSVFLIGDGVLPSNTDQGYILRRLLRRAVRYADILGLSSGIFSLLVEKVVETYDAAYPNLGERREIIIRTILSEEEKFRRTLSRGIREFEKRIGSGSLAGIDAFELFSTYGFPLEMTEELAREKGIEFDQTSFTEEFRKHQDLSRTAGAGKFKGGLADHSEKVTMLHTCTHLLLAGLRKYLGDHVHQAGSNITEERTRFDFTHGEKVPRETLDLVEGYVNEAIAKKCSMTTERMAKEEARAKGVEGRFLGEVPRYRRCLYGESCRRNSLFRGALWRAPCEEYGRYRGKFPHHQGRGFFVWSAQDKSCARIVFEVPRESRYPFFYKRSASCRLSSSLFPPCFRSLPFSWIVSGEMSIFSNCSGSKNRKKMNRASTQRPTIPSMKSISLSRANIRPGLF